MTKRGRILSFGSACLLVLAGALAAAIVGGTVGQVMAFALISLGLVLATGLVFLEVGLSEDRDRALEEERRRPAEPGPASSPSAAHGPRQASRGLARLRGSRRRLR
jgi:hypothetical protein